MARRSVGPPPALVVFLKASLLPRHLPPQHLPQLQPGHVHPLGDHEHGAVERHGHEAEGAGPSAGSFVLSPPYEAAYRHTPKCCQRVSCFPLATWGARHVARFLVIVSRDQPGQLARLTALYGDEEWLDIFLDRRHGDHGTGMGSGPDRRSPPSPETDLRERGYIVIRQSSRRAPVTDDTSG
jgi:hypothetical protein